MSPVYEICVEYGAFVDDRGGVKFVVFLDGELYSERARQICNSSEWRRVEPSELSAGQQQQFWSMVRDKDACLHEHFLSARKR